MEPTVAEGVYLTDSFSRKKMLFIPSDVGRIGMYVCGPTVYDRPHLGNARTAVVFDLLFRVLQYTYPVVVYVRNITDIDDKIIKTAKERGVSAAILADEMLGYYHADLQALNCLPPTFEPKATEHLPEIFGIIKSLLLRGFAYIAEGHVLFDVTKYDAYGSLSGRNLHEMVAGARIEVAAYKKHPLDFVLWKPERIDEIEFSFDSPWGRGRPGWHIECSAMSCKYLGSSFDIHGGGGDLLFPHHENERAQSLCASSSAEFANYWVHSGLLTVNGTKMSKSLGNFETVKNLLDGGLDATVLRYFFLTAHYKKPLDYNVKAIEDARKAVHKFRNILECIRDYPVEKNSIGAAVSPFLSLLLNDMNTPAALAYLHKLCGNKENVALLKICCDFLGFDFAAKDEQKRTSGIIEDGIRDLAARRSAAKEAGDWKLADSLRREIFKLGYEVMDSEKGYSLKRIV